jgi:hypothetical protein
MDEQRGLVATFRSQRIPNPGEWISLLLNRWGCGLALGDGAVGGRVGRGLGGVGFGGLGHAGEVGVLLHGELGLRRDGRRAAPLDLCKGWCVTLVH